MLGSLGSMGRKALGNNKKLLKVCLRGRGWWLSADWLDGYSKKGGLLKDHAGKWIKSSRQCLVELFFKLKTDLSYSHSFAKMAS
jgi:hypothetical protein